MRNPEKISAWLRCHFDQIIEKGGAAAQVGQARAAGAIAVDAIGSVLVPPDALSHDDAGFHGFPYHRAGVKAAAIVVDPYAVAVANGTDFRISRVNLDGRLAGGATQRLDIHKTRVEKLRVRRADHFQRIAAPPPPARLRGLLVGGGRRAPGQALPRPAARGHAALYRPG